MTLSGGTVELRYSNVSLSIGKVVHSTVPLCCGMV